MRRLDIVVAVVLLLLATVMVAGTRELPFWSDFAPGDRFMPILVAASVGCLALALLSTAWRRVDDGEPVAWPTGSAGRRVGSFGLAIAAFAAGAMALGFALSVFGFVFLSLVLILRKPLGTSLLAAVLSTGLVQGVFVMWLGLRLPTGPLGF